MNPALTQRPLPAITGGPIHVRLPAYEVTLVQIAGTPAFGAAAFILSQTPNYLVYTGAYDFYRVEYLEFQFDPMSNSVGLSSPTTTVAPSIFTVIDYDSANAPTTLDTLRSYSSCKIGSFSSLTRRFRPGVRTGVFDGTNVVAGAVQQPSPWLDCASTNIVHYGMKWGCDAGNVGQTNLQVWRINLTVGLAFKHTQ